MVKEMTSEIDSRSLSMLASSFERVRQLHIYMKRLLLAANYLRALIRAFHAKVTTYVRTAAKIGVSYRRWL